MTELNEIFDESDQIPTMRDLYNLHFMDKVIKETLRMWASVPFISRAVTKDFKLKCK